MENEVLVEVDGVSKKFCRDLKRSLWYGLKDLTNEFFGGVASKELRPDEFWAIDNISFKLKRGECLGLVGHNGAGKSTLLKMLNGLIKPDRGRITMRGKVGALIELGAGFNPLLTGRENIYINGQILGFSKKEVDEKFDQIVAFSEIEDFIDAPVQNYSSGMKVRLGFAVASQMEPDVLIIDEVLAVGDVGFRIKCINRIFEMAKSAAIILVSHTMPHISRIATQLMLLEKGKIAFNESDIGQGIEKYFDHFEIEEPQVSGSGLVQLHDLNVSGTVSKNHRHVLVKYKDDLVITLRLSVDSSISKFTVNVAIRDRETKLIAQIFSDVAGVDYIQNDQGAFSISIRVPNIQFSMGSYSLDVMVREHAEDEKIFRTYLANYRSFAYFKVENTFGFSKAPLRLISAWAIENDMSTVNK